MSANASSFSLGAGSSRRFSSSSRAFAIPAKYTIMGTAINRKKQPTNVAIPYNVSWTGSILNSETETNSCSVREKLTRIPSGDTNSPSTYIPTIQVVVTLSWEINSNISNSA